MVFCAEITCKYRWYLIDAVKQLEADLSSYDMIGFASGVYFSKFHQSILKFAEKNLPDDKKGIPDLHL